MRTKGSENDLPHTLMQARLDGSSQKVFSMMMQLSFSAAKIRSGLTIDI